MTAVDIPVENVTVRMLGEARCHLGEGPAYDPASDTAWWFDILEKRLHEATLADGMVRVHTLPFMASALAFIDDTGQLVAADDGLYVRTLRDGGLKLAVPLEAPPPDPMTGVRIQAASSGSAPWGEGPNPAPGRSTPSAPAN